MEKTQVVSASLSLSSFSLYSYTEAPPRLPQNPCKGMECPLMSRTVCEWNTLESAQMYFEYLVNGKGCAHPMSLVSHWTQIQFPSAMGSSAHEQPSFSSLCFVGTAALFPSWDSKDTPGALGCCCYGTHIIPCTFCALKAGDNFSETKSHSKN